MELIRAIEALFDQHAPETLMAMFGAGTSLLLFYLVWSVLQHLFGVQNRSAHQEADQEQATTALVESLVAALVTEAGHLRQSMDGILRELLRAGADNTIALSTLLDRTEQGPDAVVHLLKPEFDDLHQAMHQTEARIVAKMLEIAEPNSTTPEERDSAHSKSS